MQTHGKISDEVKVDAALSPRSLATTNATGEYFSLEEYSRAMFLTEAHEIADTKTVVSQVMQAQDAAGTGAKALTNAAATITAPTKATAAKITCVSVLDTEAITINGQTFTCETTDPDAAAGEFDAGGSDGATATNLAAVINSLLPKVKAEVNSNVVTLTSREPGEETITIADAAATMTPAVLRAQSYIEVEPSFLDLANGFTHVAIKVTTDATIVAGATLLRAPGRFSPVQAVAASKEDVSA